ncbi:MAG TPA: RlmE family RNA methyltransferase [Candidatus Binataceae bacterium]|nr:RlmE family RNA methyltransferase [Candidatus Binataceae bacterium]
MARYQPHDQFFRKARSQGLPSRAAFKLEELIARFKLIRSGARVIDLGCAPGGWLAVLALATGPEGRVVGVDLVNCVLDAPNVSTITGDIRDATVCAQVTNQLGGPANLVTCDMSPKLSGIADRDQARAHELLQSALAFARTVLKSGEAMVAKLFMGPDFEASVAPFREAFARVDLTRTKATRPGSSELYLIARGHRPPPLGR